MTALNYWMISDTHFGHNKMTLPEYGGRPEGFEELILENLRRLVKPGDVLIHLGDVSYYDHEFWHNCLNEALPPHLVAKILMRGNHDKKTLGWYYKHGWSIVSEEMVLTAYGKRILFTHKPADDSRTMFHLNVHGHLHSGNHHPECVTTEKHRLVKCEHEYAPVSLRDIVEAKGGKGC